MAIPNNDAATIADRLGQARLKKHVANEAIAWVHSKPAGYDWQPFMDKEGFALWAAVDTAKRDERRQVTHGSSKDRLPSGWYEYEHGEFQRVGDAEPLTRYHGTVLPKGEIISAFIPAPGNAKSINRPEIGIVPAVYSTFDEEAAMGYGTPKPAEEKQGKVGQLYTITITPDTIVDLGQCQDKDAAKTAIEMGVDVIECPDFWEQPETITFRDSIIEIVDAKSGQWETIGYDEETGKDIRVYSHTNPIPTKDLDIKVAKMTGPATTNVVAAPKPRERKVAGRPPRGRGRRATAGRVASAQRR